MSVLRSSYGSSQTPQAKEPSCGLSLLQTAQGEWREGSQFTERQATHARRDRRALARRESSDRRNGVFHAFAADNVGGVNDDRWCFEPAQGYGFFEPPQHVVASDRFVAEIVVETQFLDLASLDGATQKSLLFRRRVEAVAKASKHSHTLPRSCVSATQTGLFPALKDGVSAPENR